jgi:hypothetical protein
LNHPHAIIHADVKLSNDASDMSWLGDFRTAWADEEEETVRWQTRPMGTMGYMDLVFFMTGELTTSQTRMVMSCYSFSRGCLTSLSSSSPAKE